VARAKLVHDAMGHAHSGVMQAQSTVQLLNVRRAPQATIAVLQKERGDAEGAVVGCYLLHGALLFLIFVVGPLLFTGHIVLLVTLCCWSHCVLSCCCCSHYRVLSFAVAVHIVFSHSLSTRHFVCIAYCPLLLPCSSYRWLPLLTMGQLLHSATADFCCHLRIQMHCGKLRRAGRIQVPSMPPRTIYTVLRTSCEDA
jgi:hypothetical protein